MATINRPWDLSGRHSFSCNYSLGSYLKHQLRIVLSCFTPSILYSIKPWQQNAWPVAYVPLLDQTVDPTVSTESVELWNSAGSTAASKLAWGDSLNLHLGVFDQTSTDRLLCFIVVLEFVCSCLVCSRLVCLCKYRPHGPNDSLNAFVLLAFSKLLLFSSCISAWGNSLCAVCFLEVYFCFIMYLPEVSTAHPYVQNNSYVKSIPKW